MYLLTGRYLAGSLTAPPNTTTSLDAGTTRKPEPEPHCLVRTYLVLTFFEMDKDVIHIYVTIALFCLSFVMISISLVIFFKFRQLQCDRITIHKNLFISYLLTDLFYLVYLSVIHFAEDVVLHNPDWCQFLHVITQYAIVCNFAWMFCEGLYLHTVMMSAFTSGKSVIIACLIIGWGVGAARAVFCGLCTPLWSYPWR